jgi:hypothetical protein
MRDTQNHEYNVPEPGDENWHEPLNENFEAFDADVEIRDTDRNRGDYDPKRGAKFYATDTGNVYVGNGSNWNKVPSSGRNPFFQDRSVARLGAKATLSSRASIPNDTNTVVPFDSVVFDDRGEFDTGSHEFVAATDGRYHVITQLNFDLQVAPSDAEFVKVDVLKNGASNIARNDISAGNPGQFPRVQTSVHLQLDAGDTVAVQTRHKSNGSANLLGEWLSVVRLG